MVIVDKGVRALGALRLAPGEQWFERDAVKRWLLEHCSDVSAVDITRVDGAVAPPLLVAWMGERA